MATITQTALTRPVNSAVALAALKAANTAQDASQDTTVKLIALRKELDALRAERDAARFRVEDLEAQTSRLHQALQRTSAATSALRNCPRRLPRSMSFMAALASFALAGMAFWTTPAAASELYSDEGAPGRCLLQVDGKTYLKGRCNITMLDRDGSFCIGCGSDEVGSDHFAYVLRSGGLPTTGSWNGPDMYRKADNPLGDLRRNGACWLNARAKICAWK